MFGEEKTIIHPEDWLYNMDEYLDGSKPDARATLFIKPFGRYAIEVADANYFPGDTVGYHEHWRGYETFLVDNGSFEIHSKSKFAVAKKGDMVHIPPYTPHAIKALEHNSIWRSFHQEIHMLPEMHEERRLFKLHPEVFDDPEFKANYHERLSTMFYEFQEQSEEIPASEMILIRPYDWGSAVFRFGDASFLLKAGRWETHGAKEIWQMRLPKGFTITFDERNPYHNIYDVFSGSVSVRLEGEADATASTRDLINIPKYWRGSLTMLEDTVLIDAYSQGALLRSFDELRWFQVNEPDKLADESFVRGVFVKNDYHKFFPLI